MNDTPDRETLHISRYSSRRLYNTGAGEYVKVDDLAKLIRAGHDIKVVDKKSGDDITSQILLQIIAEQEAESGSVLPANILMEAVRQYSTDTKLVPDFLAESFSKIKAHQKKLSGTFLDQITDPLNPQRALNSLDTLREVQRDIVGSVAAAWLPGNKDQPKSQPDAVEKSDGEDEANLSSQLVELKQQMADMQSKLEALQKEKP